MALLLTFSHRQCILNQMSLTSICSLFSNNKNFNVNGKMKEKDISSTVLWGDSEKNLIKLWDERKKVKHCRIIIIMTETCKLTFYVLSSRCFFCQVLLKFFCRWNFFKIIFSSSFLRSFEEFSRSEWGVFV